MPVQLELGVFSAEVSVTAARAERETRQIPLHVDTITRAADRADQPALDRRRAVAGGQHHAGRQRSVRRAPAAARARLDAPAGARGRRTAQHRAPGDRPHRRRSGPDLARRHQPDGDRQRRRHAALRLRRAGRHDQHHHQRAGVLERHAAGCTASTASTARTRTAGARHGDDRRDRRRATPFACRRAWSRSTTTRPAASTSRTRGRSSPSGSAQPGRHHRRQLRLRLQRAFPDPFNAPYVRTERRDPELEREGQLRQRVESGEARRRSGRCASATSAGGWTTSASPTSRRPTSSTPPRCRTAISIASRRATRRRRSRRGWPTSRSPRTTSGPSVCCRTCCRCSSRRRPPVAFFPISVIRLDILSETEQRVWTPGVDLQAVFVPASNHVLTTGLTFYRDRSSDARTTTTTTSMVGQVALGQRGPAPVVFPAPVQLGPPSVAHPVRVPDASLRDVAVFAQDEWRLRPNLSLVAGLRGDFYNVTTEATPGYDVASVVAGARPAIDPATLPDPNGATYARQALTGDIGLVANTGGRVSPFVRFGRSYRHPEPRGDAVRRSGHGRQHRAQRHGQAGAGQQLRCRRQVQLPACLGRRVRLRQPVQGFRRPGSDDGRHAGRPAGAGHQLRRRADPRPGAVGRRAGGHSGRAF